jgi:putative phosphoesterase
VRIAVLSDIHGNRLALEAVLDDIARQSVDMTVNLGDILSGPIDPEGTVAILRSADFPTVRGNHDRTIIVPPDPDNTVDSFARGRLSHADMFWLRAAPATMTIANDIFLCHGTPTSDDAPWLDDWFEDRTMTLPDEALVTRLAGDFDYPVMLCGHTHVARAVRLKDNRLIVNPGSVGLQLMYGSPDARYAVIERHRGQWSANLKAIPYDHESAAEEAATNGFPQWRRALSSGWVGTKGLFGPLPAA